MLNRKDMEKRVRNNLHLFEIDNKYYVFDIYNFVRIQVSKRLYELINNMILEVSMDHQYAKELDALELLYNEGIFTINYESDNNYENDNEINAYLSFAPIYKCNFNCRYCFGEAGEIYNHELKSFTPTLVEKVLTSFFYNIYPEAVNYRIDFVSGGEPLLNIEAIKATIDYVEKFQINTGKNVVLWLCTNGSKINNDICEYLDRHNVTIGVSLDGIREKHNLNRIDAYGEPTYDTVINGINIIKSSSYISHKFKNIWILTVITPENCDLVEIIKHHYDLGIRSIQMKLIRSKTITNNLHMLMHNNYLNLSRFLLEQYISGNDEYLYMILNDYDYFGKILKRIIINQMRTFRCLAGKNKITICPNGDIYPCDSFVGNNDMVIGNIYNNLDLNKNLITTRHVTNRKKCNKCSIRFLCGGDCYFNSFIKTGDLCGSDEEMCKIMNSICNCAIWLSCEMERYDRNHFEKIVKHIQIKEKFTII